MVTRYGIISDIHEDPRIIHPLLEALVQKGADKLIVNGDIGGNYGSLENSQKYTAYILDKIGKTGLESYVQPGGHESIAGFHPVLEFFSKKYSNIKNIFNGNKIEAHDHQVVFLPGSDFLCGGGYQFGNSDELSTGMYESKHGSLFYQNIRDLRSLVTTPDKTIVVCHVPRKFETVERGVDVAHFYESREYSRGKNNYDSKGVFPVVAFNPAIVERDNTPVYSLRIEDSQIRSSVTSELWARGLDTLKVLVERNENRGNKDLKNIYEELGITKAVSGHFHESSHRAHDSKGNFIPENTSTKELFWNSGHADRGLAGILTVNGEEVSYENIKLDKEDEKH